MYHKIVLVGYLGRDPEMRYTTDGAPVTNFSVAASRKYTRQDGTQVDETIWFRVTTWRKLAETCKEYLKKGRLVLVEGRLQAAENGNPRTFTRSDGSVGASFEVTAETVRFLGGARGEDGDGAPAEPAPEEGESDIPF
jgi:single-strand DNA-binding protein